MNNKSFVQQWEKLTSSNHLNQQFCKIIQFQSTRNIKKLTTQNKNSVLNMQKSFFQTIAIFLWKYNKYPKTIINEYH